ncbi:hypothetical protein Barb7_00516 [Bacteroidales bacterium Barb7]|nr:hypothetical protein Barb7_00516 [Bacteroidales bacterium Barb7]
MRRRIVLAGLCLACVFQTMEAETVDVTVNNLVYTIGDLNSNTASIVQDKNRNYSVDSALVIQAEFIYDGQRFFVTEIGDNAFYRFRRIKSVTIPNSVTSIGKCAFEYCDSLPSVTIPNSVTSIGDLAFDHCDSLTSVTISNSVTSIGDLAFGYCTSLTSVTIPNSVTSIGDRAFFTCQNLQNIYLKWDDPNMCTFVEPGVFDYVSEDCKVHIPKSSEKKYGWDSNATWKSNAEDMKWQGYPIALNYYAVATQTNDLAMGHVTDEGISDDMTYGTKVKLTANPVDNYRLVKWTNAKGDSLSAANPYLFNVTEDMTIQAHFAINSYRVDLSAKNGTITSDNSTYTHGAEAKVEASPNTNYRFVKWTDAKGDSLSIDNPYTFIVTSDMAIQAHFVINSYRVNLSAENGTVTSDNNTYTHGARAMAEASPYAGHHFVKWTNMEGDSLSAANPYTFVVTSDTAIQAHFAISSYQVDLFASENGRIKSGGGIYVYNTEAEASAEADSGYYFVMWINGAGDSISTDNPYKFAVKGKTSLTAVFEKGYKGDTGNEVVSGGEARVYYAEGILHLVGLEGADISVYAIDGRQILQFKANDTEHPVALPAGIYMLNATGGKGRHVAKFVVKE